MEPLFCPGRIGRACRHGAVALRARWLGCAGWLLLVAGMAMGCAGYKLGPSNGMPAGEHSIQVGPIANSTMEPRLGEALSHAMRQEIQRDGTFTLNTEGLADILFSAEITRYTRRELSYQPRDTLTARDYEIFMYARVQAIERRTGKELLGKTVRGRTTVRIGSDLVSAERQALPLLAEDLARNVTSMLADGSW